jgi:hypothetical protein
MQQLSHSRAYCINLICSLRQSFRSARPHLPFHFLPVIIIVPLIVWDPELDCTFVRSEIKIVPVVVLFLLYPHMSHPICCRHVMMHVVERQ